MSIRSLTLGLPLCALAATGTIAAQSPFEFGIYPNATNGTARTGIGTAGGDVVIQASADSFRGVAQSLVPGGFAGRVNGYVYFLQDQSAATVETHAFVIRRDDPRLPGQPDPTSGGIIARGGSSVTPPGFTGPVSWEFTAQFGTAVDVPQDQSFYFGVNLSPSPAWPSDGMSIHQASYYAVPGLLPRHDNPRIGAPDISWGVVPSQVQVRQEDDPRTHNIRLLTQGVVLHNGADIAPAHQVGPNPNFGVAGLYPDTTGRRDGLAFRIRAFNPGAPVIVLAAPGFTTIPLGSPLIEGVLWLDWLHLVTVTTATMPSSGELVLQPPGLAQGQLQPFVGSVAFQALVLGSQGLRASNATLTSFQ